MLDTILAGASVKTTCTPNQVSTPFAFAVVGKLFGRQLKTQNDLQTLAIRRFCDGDAHAQLVMIQESCKVSFELTGD